MLEVVFEPDGTPADPELTDHRVIHNVLDRCLFDLEPCPCPHPWTRIWVSDDWRFGKLDVTDMQACCPTRRQESIERLRWSTLSQGCGEGQRAEGLPEPAETRLAPGKTRLLLGDCASRQGTISKDGFVRATLHCDAEGRPRIERRGSVVVECEELRLDGARVTSLLLRAYYGGPDFTESLAQDVPFEIVAYWRRYGLDWSPRAIDAAERFGMGVGGSFVATVTRLGGLAAILPWTEPNALTPLGDRAG